MFKLKSALAATFVIGATTFAAANAENPEVQKRQEAMKTIGANVKALTRMAKGEVDFDAAKAQAAFATISGTAAQVPALFESEADDPESEAAAEIWFMWEDFVSKAGALKAVAGAGADVDSPGALGAALGELGGACKACHSKYKL